MENVVLTVHLILALLLIGVVLLQRSEGGGLGIGGGGGGVMTGRQAANAMSRATWLLATGFLITSITLTVLAASNSAGGSVVDRIGGTPIPSNNAPASNLPTLPTYTPPPGAGQPVLPPTSAPAAAPADGAAPAAGAATQPAADAQPAAVAQPVTPPAADAAPGATDASSDVTPPAEPATPAN